MMKVKIGDNVKILAGKDRGKEGKVLKTLKKKDKVVVEGINIVKKHSKPNNTNDNGGIFSVEAPIHVSNVKVVEATKAAKKVDKKEEKVEKVEKEAKATKTTKTTKKASK
jgi:large subunit ribosomal protein L24